MKLVYGRLALPFFGKPMIGAAPCGPLWRRCWKRND